MRASQKIGLAALGLWGGVNLLLGLVIFVAVGFFGEPAPALRILFDDAYIRAIDPPLLGTVSAMAVLTNALAAAFSALVLILAWQAVRRGERWIFWSLAGTLTFVQTAGFVSDAFLGHANVAANGVSALLAGVGLVLVGRRA